MTDTTPQDLPQFPPHLAKDYKKLADLFIKLLPSAAEYFCNQLPGEATETRKMIEKAYLPFITERLNDPKIKKQVAFLLLSELVYFNIRMTVERDQNEKENQKAQEKEEAPSGRIIIP